MENKTLIKDSFLDENDKKLLIEMIEKNLYPKNVSTLSIFSKKGIECKINDFTYSKYENNHVYYFKNIDIWIDDEFKLLPYSNWWYETDINRFLQHVNVYLSILKFINTNVNKVSLLEGNYISVTKWFVTYGHFLDEIFCLKDFLINNDLKDTTPFISFNINNNIYGNDNYKIFCDLLFEKYHDANIDLIKVNNLILIKHLYNDKKFHSFSQIVAEQIINKVSNCNTKNVEISDKYIFITRGKDPPHIQRNFKNKEEIEKYLFNKNVHVFNPENHDIYDMIKNIKKHCNIIITWGSTLTNLCFCNENTNVIILKSDSYKHESIKLFNKIIDSRKLKIKIIESINNEIDPKSIL